MPFVISGINDVGFSNQHVAFIKAHIWAAELDLGPTDLPSIDLNIDHTGNSGEYSLPEGKCPGVMSRSAQKLLVTFSQKS